MRQLAVLGALQSMIDDLAEELSRSVVVDDPQIVMICSSRHFGDEDPVRVRAVLQRAVDPDVARFVLAQRPGRWSAPGMLAASTDLDLKARLCVPLREQGVLLGLLMVIDADRSLRPSEIELITRAAGRMSALMYADHVAADATRLRLATLIADLLGEHPDHRSAARRTLLAEGQLRDDLVVVSVITTAESGTARVPVSLVGEAVTVASGTDGTSLVAVVDDLTHLVRRPPGAFSGADLHHHGVQLATSVRRRLPGRPTVQIGVGSTQPDLDTAWRSADHARTALRTARRIQELDGVGVWSELGEYAVLAQLDPEVLVDAPVGEPISRLITGDPSGRLLQTLTTYLDQAGSIPRTAEALHLHRTSLYYRLNQITRLTGVDLDDGRTRFRLQLALRLGELGPTQP